jgi:hypothetical protein
MDSPEKPNFSKLIRDHLTKCAVAFFFFELGRFITLRQAPADALIIPQFSITFYIDFLTTVLLLGIMRAFYAIPILFVRKSLGRALDYILFGLVFAVVFTGRTEKALGIAPENTADIVVYHSRPQSNRILKKPEPGRFFIRKTSLVSLIDDTRGEIRFKPVFNFDTTGLAAVNRIYAELNSRPEPQSGS